MRQLSLLTMKPIIYAANVAEGQLAAPEENPHVQALSAMAQEEGAEVVVVSAQVQRTVRLCTDIIRQGGMKMDREPTIEVLV